MRAAVIVVGPMPSPRKKMMFFASGAAIAGAWNAAASSSAQMWFAQLWFIFIVDLLVQGLPAGRFPDEREHAGIVDGAAEELRAGARRAQVDVGTAMGLRAHADGRLLVIIVAAGDGVGESGPGRA